MTDPREIAQRILKTIFGPTHCPEHLNTHEVKALFDSVEAILAAEIPRWVPVEMFQEWFERTEKFPAQDITAYDSKHIFEWIADYTAAILATAHKWVRCAEKLPDENETVLILTPAGQRVSTYGRANGNLGFINFEHGWTYIVTHWQPLPSPPKETP